MNRIARLLISARDPGAAAHLLPIARDLADDSRFALQLVAAPPAERLFAQAGLDFTSVPERGGELLDRVARLLERHRPNAILTGLSGPDWGLDEALLAAADDIPTYAYQDFWGDVNLAAGEAADLYFVRDAYAARLTRLRFGLPSVVVGAPVACPRDGRRYTRRRSRLARFRVGWCGQPLWDVPGYAQTFRSFARLFRHATIVVKPHPKESDRQRLRYRTQASGRNVVLWRDSLERLFGECALVASAFSNCALEQLEFNQRPGGGYSLPVQLLFERQLKDVYRTWTGIEALPLADQGLLLGVQSRAMLAQALSERGRQHFVNQSRLRSGRNSNSRPTSRLIAATILSRLDNTPPSGEPSRSTPTIAADTG